MRRREPQKIVLGVARESEVARGISPLVSDPPWDELGHDEKMEAIRRSLEYYERLVEERTAEAADRLDDLEERLSQRTAEAADRLDDLEERLSQFESTVDERFGGHEARDQTILGFELVGGVVSLLGTVIVIFAQG